MPQKHGSQLSKRQKTSLAGQKARLTMAAEDTDAFFGRVLKINMARCTVNVWDHTAKRHIEVQARLPNKKKGIIRINDLVNLAKSHPDWEVQVAVDSKTAAELRKNKRISVELAADSNGTMSAAAAAAASDGFEFDYDGVEVTEDIDAVAAAAAEIKDKNVGRDDDDAFDIDAI